MFSNDSKVYLFDHDTSVKKIGISNTDSDSTKYRAKISDNFSIGNTIILILPLNPHHHHHHPYPYPYHILPHYPPLHHLGDAPNGGYLMTIAINAARESVPQFRDPFSITGHYVNKSLEHVDADVYVKVLNTAKSSATVEISIVQEDRLRVKYLCTLGIITSLIHHHHHH
jgi:hypothetical protein